MAHGVHVHPLDKPIINNGSLRYETYIDVHFEAPRRVPFNRISAKLKSVADVIVYEL